MIITLWTVLALFGTQADPEVLPPPPTEAEMLAAFQAEQPGVRIIAHQATPTYGGRVKVCGTAEIAGQAEPFALFAEEGARTSAVITLAGQEPPTQFPGPRPRHWKTTVFSPGGWNFIENARSDPRVQGLDAFARQTALRSCPDLQPPAGVTWRTQVRD